MKTYKSHKYNYFYKITNSINNHFYYGVHSTDNLNDGYMGSGVRLRYAYNKYGIENFTKEILKYFDTIDEAYEYEAEIVNENLINAEECYNLCKGGIGGWGITGYVVVKDKYGETCRVSVNDERYLSGELIPIACGYVAVKDKNGKCYQVSINDERYLNGELISIATNKTAVKDKNGNVFCIDMNDPRYINKEVIPVNCGKCFYKDENENIVFTSTNDKRVLSGELKHVTTGRVTVKDKYGNFYSVYKDDPRYISGELVPNCVGHHLSEETKQKLRQNHVDNKGEKNGQFGKHWYHYIDEDGNILNKSLSDKESIEYIKNGWKLGRKIINYKNGKFCKLSEI